MTGDPSSSTTPDSLGTADGRASNDSSDVGSETVPPVTPSSESVGGPAVPPGESGFTDPLPVPDAIPEADSQETIDGWEASQSMEGEAPSG